MGGFVLHRLRSHRLLIFAAVLTVLLTTAALAALTAYSTDVTDAGVQRALQVTDRSQTPLLMADQTDRSSIASVRAAAAATGRSAFPRLRVSAWLLVCRSCDRSTTSGVR